MRFGYADCINVLQRLLSISLEQGASLQCMEAILKSHRNLPRPLFLTILSQRKRLGEGKRC